MTIEISLFNQTWYHKMIQQEMDCHPNANENARIAARATMVAGAFIAEAIAHAFEEQSDTTTLVHALQDLATAVEKIGDTMEE